MKDKNENIAQIETGECRNCGKSNCSDSVENRAVVTNGTDKSAPHFGR